MNVAYFFGRFPRLFRYAEHGARLPSNPPWTASNAMDALAFRRLGVERQPKLANWLVTRRSEFRPPISAAHLSRPQARRATLVAQRYRGLLFPRGPIYVP